MFVVKYMYIVVAKVKVRGYEYINSMTTNNTSSCLGGLKVTHQMSRMSLIPGSDKSFNLCLFVLLLM